MNALKHKVVYVWEINWSIQFILQVWRIEI